MKIQITVKYIGEKIYSMETKRNYLEGFGNN